MTNSEIIFSYTRPEAIADGVLVDVTPAAAEVGIRYPVVLTAEAHATCVVPPSGVPGQDERGRLHDVVMMLRQELLSRPSPPRFPFTVLVQNDARTPQPVRLNCVLSFEKHRVEDTKAGPVLTVMMPWED